MQEIKGIDYTPVTEWLTQQIPDLQPPLYYEHITGGRSNLTYTVTDASQQCYILRRPPLGNILETAHNVVREYRIMEGIGQTDVPVPKTVVACEDKAINGSAFTIVHHVAGVVLHEETAARVVPMVEREQLGHHVIQVLAALHQVDPDAVGLGDLGRRDGYIERQLRRWSRQLEAAQERELPTMDEVHTRLIANVPVPPQLSIVHGDYRLGNLISHNGQVQAVLDWELCTLGDPLADLGYLLNTWIGPDDPVLWDRPPTLVGGFISQEELIDEYAALTGFDVSGIDYYRAFAYWRFAAILEGVRIRHLHGAHGKSNIDLESLAQSVVSYADAALALC